MAGDIVLYDADIVPVWQDQKQHLEFCRDIAQRFNDHFGETLKLPDPYIDENVAVVPWIDGRKMSKSYNNFLWLLDDEKTLRKKIKQITTASLPVEAVKNPDECNVYLLSKLFTTAEEDVAVSYTHLDVYKRQGLCDDFSSFHSWCIDIFSICIILYFAKVFLIILFLWSYNMEQYLLVK